MILFCHLVVAVFFAVVVVIVVVCIFIFYSFAKQIYLSRKSFVTVVGFCQSALRKFIWFCNCVNVFFAIISVCLLYRFCCCCRRWLSFFIALPYKFEFVTRLSRQLHLILKCGLSRFLYISLLQLSQTHIFCHCNTKKGGRVWYTHAQIISHEIN